MSTLALRRRRFRLVTLAVAAPLLLAAQVAGRVEPRAVPVLVAAGAGAAASGGGLAGLVLAVFGAGLAPLSTPLRIAFGVGALIVSERSGRLAEEAERVEDQSCTDRLTGLRSYAFFRETLSHEVQRVRRYGGSCALIVLDLDRFKQFNDRYGHAAGNVLLNQVGTVIRDLTRQSDVAARFGGEELVVLVPGSAEQAALLAERIRSAVERLDLRETGRRQVGVTLSAGVAAYPDDAGKASELFAAADAALYAAKNAGRNRVVLAGQPRHEGRLAQSRAG